MTALFRWRCWQSPKAQKRRKITHRINININIMPISKPQFIRIKHWTVSHRANGFVFWLAYKINCAQPMWSFIVSINLGKKSINFDVPTVLIAQSLTMPNTNILWKMVLKHGGSDDDDRLLLAFMCSFIEKSSHKIASGNWQHKHNEYSLANSLSSSHHREKIARQKINANCFSFTKSNCRWNIDSKQIKKRKKYKILNKAKQTKNYPALVKAIKMTHDSQLKAILSTLPSSSASFFAHFMCFWSVTSQLGGIYGNSVKYFWTTYVKKKQSTEKTKRYAIFVISTLK